MASPAATAAGADAIDVAGLLAEMVDRARIAELPDPAFVCKQVSSYNRKSKKPGNVGWFATDDYSNLHGMDEVDGRREWIMLDVDAPGTIVRWWITQYKYDGTIRIYLDGSDKPAGEGKGNESVGGRGAGVGAMRNGMTLGEAMKRTRYFTIMTGKWHLGSQPTQRGFDRYFGHLSGAAELSITLIAAGGLGSRATRAMPSLPPRSRCTAR